MLEHIVRELDISALQMNVDHLNYHEITRIIYRIVEVTELIQKADEEVKTAINRAAELECERCIAIVSRLVGGIGDGEGEG